MPALFTGEIMPDAGFTILGRTFDGESLFGYTVSFAAILAFLFSPVLGAVGDFSGSKLRFLRVFAYAGAALSTLFALAGPGDVWFTIAPVSGRRELLGDRAGLLRQLPAPHHDSGHRSTGSRRAVSRSDISAADSSSCCRSLLLQFSPESFQSTAARIGIVFAGIWWLGFSIFSFRRLSRAGPTAGAAREVLGGVGARGPIYGSASIARSTTTRRLRLFPQLLLFLLAFLLYNDGVQTVISISAAYATETLDLETADVALAFLVVQVVAFGGALAFGWLASKIGPKRAILISLVLWTGVSVLGYFLPAGSIPAVRRTGGVGRPRARRHPGLSVPKPRYRLHDPRNGRIDPAGRR